MNDRFFFVTSCMKCPWCPEEVGDCTHPEMIEKFGEPPSIPQDVLDSGQVWDICPLDVVWMWLP